MHPTARAALRQLERNDLSTLQGVIGCAKACLRRDADGDWWLVGRKGYITTTSRSFSITVNPQSSGRWRSIKRALAGFTSIGFDGHADGVLRLMRRPGEAEAELLRQAIGLRATRPAAAADHLNRHREDAA